MKKIYLKLIIVVFFVNTGHGQGYIPFPDSNAVWSVMTFWNNPIPPPIYWDYWTTHYGMAEDTIINNVGYKKLEKSEDSVFIANAPANNYAGALRGDETNRRVYYVPADSVNETLIYDFLINVDDTIVINNSYSGQAELWCTDIDTIQIDEIPYKRLAIDISYDGTGFTHTTNWIEGIGSLDGLLDTYYYLPLLFNEKTTNLLCFQQDGLLVHHWGYYEGCYQKFDITASVSGNKAVTKNNPFMIEPNPVTDISTIETGFLTDEVCIAEILNINGETIKKLVIKKDSKIYGNDFKPGIYFMRIIRGGQVFITKFIIN